MRRYKFLIILLGFIGELLSTEFTNVTIKGYCNNSGVYANTSSRRKRALSEYTRWRSNTDATQEFIVKVLDDETTPSSNKKHGAINTLLAVPVVKRAEMKVVGGVIAPQVAPDSSPPAPHPPGLDYTRFGRPTQPEDLNIIDEKHDLQTQELRPGIVLSESHAPALRTYRRDNDKENLDELNDPDKKQLPVLLPMRDDASPIRPLFLAHSRLSSPHFPHIEPREYQTSKKSDISTQAYRKYEVQPILHRYPKFNEYSESDVTLPRATTFGYPSRTKTITTEPLDSNDEDLESVHPTSDFLDNIRKELEKELDLRFNKKISHKDYNAPYSDLFDEENYDETGRKKGKENGDKTAEKNENEIDKEINSLDENDQMTVHAEVTEIINNENAGWAFTEYWNVNYTMGERRFLDEKASSTVNDSVSNYNIPNSIKRANCNLVEYKPLNFESPHTLADITTKLRTWAEKSPIVQYLDITAGNFTFMENPIYMMVIDDPSTGQITNAKKTILIVAGILGSDRRAVASAMYLLYQLIDRSADNSDTLAMFRFWVIPVLNPDGYDYSLTFDHARKWTKNLHQYWETCFGKEYCKDCELHGIRCTIESCFGVNLDRNFEYQWIPPKEVGADRPCGGLYSGERQLSEVESFALTDFLRGHRTPISVFIALKEGPVLKFRAMGAASAAYEQTKRTYLAGQTSEFLDLYAGGIEDWVDGHLAIKSIYTIMLHKKDSKSDEISYMNNVKEVFSAITALINEDSGPLTDNQNRRRMIHYDKQITGNNTSRKKLLTIIPIVLFVLLIFL